MRDREARTLERLFRSPRWRTYCEKSGYKKRGLRLSRKWIAK